MSLTIDPAEYKRLVKQGKEWKRLQGIERENAALREELAQAREKAADYDFVCRKLGTKDHILGVVEALREELKAARAVIKLARICYTSPAFPSEASPSEVRTRAKAYLARYPERTEG